MQLRCREVFQCKEKACPAYGSKGPACWLIPRTRCRSDIGGLFLDKIEMCLECEFFKANMHFDFMEGTLKIVNRRLVDCRRKAEGQRIELESTKKELACGLSEAIEALREIASGNPGIRIGEKGQLEPIRNLQQMINVTAENLGEIVNLSHEFAIGLAEHFGVLDRVLKGDLNARVCGISEVELLESLKNATNKMIESVSKEMAERKLAEEILRHSEERYRRITEAVTDYIFTVRIQDGRPVETVHSSACVGVTGYSAEDFANDPYLWFRMVHEEDRSAVEEQAGQVVSGREVQPLEHRIYRKDHVMRWVKNSLVAHCDPQGKILSYDGLISDIHERKCAEEALRESEEKFKTLFNSANDAVYIHDFHGEMFEVNQVACNRLGYSHDELSRMALTGLAMPEQVPLVIEKLKELQEKEYLRFETAHVDLHGNIMPVEIISQTIEYNGKQAVMSTARDISERKQAEEEKRKLEARLIQAHKMEAIGTLAGGIAHDFNNILAAIMGYSELVELDLSKEDRASDNLGEVLKAANRAKQLVRQLLTFSRQSEPEPKPLQMTPIVKEALKLIRASIPATIKIRQEIHCEPDIVLADDVQIHQVLINLCSNAAHAMQGNGGLLNVKLVNLELDAEDLLQYPNLRAGPYIRLSVSDTGCGMDREIKERIFDPFFTTKGPGEGTGMGLAVVHGIVNSHGGAITVYSEPDQGTTFHVLLPGVDGKAPVKDEKMVSLLRGSERILLLDDEKTLVTMGERMLKRLGYRVVPQTSSVEALEAFRAQPDKFDLVITDQTMPDMTGEHLSRELMNIRSDIPIILCTGYSQIISEKDARAMGIAGYIMKPMVMRELARVIRDVLDRKK